MTFAFVLALRNMKVMVTYMSFGLERVLSLHSLESLLFLQCKQEKQEVSSIFVSILTNAGGGRG